ncbi:MAG: glycosyltransferase [Candidatus Thiodiazotropha sp. (ex Lucinoma borealis)]|nr:glycosyltransferase [Candidatus Thiodiazotropha sp. (ex Lucinoma borealis)]
MKVLHIINGEHYSGAERVQDLLVQKLPKYNIDVYLACIKPNKFLKRCECDISKIVEFPMSSRMDFSQAIKISSFVKKSDINLIHTHTPRTALIGYIASKVSGLPLVHHVHSPTMRDTENNRKNSINASIEKYVMKRSSSIITVSNSLKQYLLNIGLSDNNISVVLNGVKSLKLLPSRDIPHAEWTIGVIALFRPRKGIEILLESLSKIVVDGNQHIKLRAIGEFESEDYKKEIINLTMTLGLSEYIHWVGFSNDIERELGMIDIFILPSLYGEGLPMVILEAMANGVPVISTNVEGVPEAIPSDEYGIVVEPGNPESLSTAIQQLIESEGMWSGIRKRAYKHQLEYLSADAMAKGVADVYTKVFSAQ